MKYSIIVIISSVSISGLSKVIPFSTTISGFILRMIFVIGMSGTFYFTVIMLDPERHYFLNMVQRIIQKVGRRR